MPFERGANSIFDRSDNAVNAKPSTFRQIGSRLSIRRKKKHVDKAEPATTGIKYISHTEAISILQELRDEYKYSSEMIIELFGMSCASVITKVYPMTPAAVNPLGKFSILVVCGPGEAGAVGLVSARHLKYFGYSPTIYYPEPSLDTVHKQIFRQVEAFEIPSLSYLPNEPQLITHSYNLILECLTDMDNDGYVSDHISGIIDRLRKCELPVISIDVPGGWNADAGRPKDDTEDASLAPECLISLISPKLCAKSFTGKYHYVAGRFIPTALADRHSLGYPNFPLDSGYVIDMNEADYSSHPAAGGQIDHPAQDPDTHIHGQE